MDSELWRSQVLAVLERIADEDYQRLAWFNRHREISSPGELICQLYDDHLFDDFVESEGIGLLPDQRREARRFSELMTEFCEATPNKLDAHLVIDDPRWVKIREEARQLLRVLFGGAAGSIPSPVL